ncbi:EAL domain-containing protein [Vibrio sp. 404]|uniref:EAL domain-containing protein n=2 Tax=Vibrio marinisediminis TaxID=2758441 RepID=A0A7W2FRY0_9VIBR|nr:EAL domain-containing protein [Vibrio marinisediminis]
MNDVMSHLANTESGMEEKKPKYLVYDWEINLATQEFSCDHDVQQLFFAQSFDSLPVNEFLKLVPRQQKKTIKAAFRKALVSDQEVYCHCCLLIPNALFAYVELSISRHGDQQLKGSVSPCMIVPGATEAAELFYSIFENQHQGIVVTDAETRILACNYKFESMSGYLRHEIVGLKTHIFNSSQHDEHYFQQLWDALNDAGYWSGVLLSRHANGEVFPQNLTIQSISLSNGKHYYLGFYSDLSSHLDRIEDINCGGVDLLTQLPVSERFINDLERQCEIKESANNLLVVAMQPNLSSDNVTNLKRQFAQYLKAHTNAVCCGYMDGGRFLAALPIVVESPNEPIRDIAKTLGLFFQCFKQGGEVLHTQVKTGKVGVSIYGVDADTPRRLVSHACQTLLELQPGDRRTMVFYEREIHHQIERKKRLETHLLQALDNGDVEVRFQPIFDLKARRIERFEALCHIPPLEGEEVKTPEYIAIAQDINQHTRLDAWVTGLALNQFKLLSQKFGDHVELSINRSFSDDDDVYEELKKLSLALDKADVSPDKLTIECTNVAFLLGKEKNRQIIQLLREAGVSIAVDGFGTGYASFGYLKDPLIDVLKINRQFIANVQPNSREYVLIDTLIQLSHKLGLTVVAEGVDSEQEWQAVSQLGVEYVQGNYIAPPQQLEQIITQNDYGQLPENGFVEPSHSIIRLANLQLKYLDPGDPLSLAYQYFEDSHSDILPVIDKKQCVGVVDRAAVNLHMTPNMGTDLESSKEQGNWSKSVNRMMKPVKCTLSYLTDLNEVRHLATTEPFPWLLVDEKGHYKGLVESFSVIKYLADS